MRIACISDTHRFHRQIKVPKCDTVVFAGDAGWEDEIHGYNSMLDWFDWFSQLPATNKIFIAGNHDRLAEYHPQLIEEHAEVHDLIYLNNNSITVDGIKFYGSPYSLEFCGWSFAIPRQENIAKPFWSYMPENADVVITHGPPLGILDNTVYDPEGHFGDSWLLERIHQVRPRVHVFGHLHHSGGQWRWQNGVGIQYVNASICNEQYEPINPVITVDI